MFENTSLKLTNHLYEVIPGIKIPDYVSYYPEAYLLSQLNHSVYTLANDPTVEDIIESYNTIIGKEGGIETIYLVVI